MLSPEGQGSPSAQAPDELKRPALGLGSKESLDGNRQARAAGHRRPPLSSLPSRAHARPHLSEGSSCVRVQQGPNLQKGPGRAVPGSAHSRRSRRRGSRAWRGLGYRLVTPG